MLYYGRLAFLEPTVTMWLTIGSLLVLRARSDRSGRWGALAGLTLALAVGTKPSALFAVAGLLVAVAIYGRRDPAVRRWVGGALLAIAALAVGWVLVIGLPNRAAVAVDLRIWASEPIFGPIRTMATRVLSFPFRSDGFLLLAAPILAFGAGGWLLAVRARRRLPPGIALLVVMATGWLVAGLGLLFLAPYRPNRYEAPLLPALAILGGVGAWVVVSAERAWPRPRLAVAGVAVAAALVLPGLVSYSTWMRGATYRLPEIQAALASTVPPGSAMQGVLAPAFGLRAPAATIVSRPWVRVSPGDLYATRGVRWFVGAEGEAPAWASKHADAWAARTTVLCSPWGSQRVCVWHLP